MNVLKTTATITLILLLGRCETLDQAEVITRIDLPLEELDVPADFDYATHQDVQVEVKTQTPAGVTLGDVRIDLYYTNIENEQTRVLSGITDESGSYNRIVRIPAYVENLTVETQTIGLVRAITKPVENGVLVMDFAKVEESLPEDDESDYTLGKSAVVDLPYEISVLGAYSRWFGVPEYLMNPGDDISAEFLTDLNASLPESDPVPQAHPEYLAEGNQINTRIQENADVWITFVHEGAGHKNILGYYVYPADNPPQSAEEIDTVHVIFPNVSFAGSGGGLNSGDKVYLGYFESGMELGWVLFADGWRWGIGTGFDQFYSNPDFNPEESAETRQHNVLLYDEARDLTVLGFEDLHRDSGSDDDFNDALFYVTSNPRTAIVIDSVETITYTGNDTDGDGVNDPVDDYPDDPDKAFDNYSPSDQIFGSLSFEDLWPYQGDYDFNDLVVDYQFVEIMNSSNELVELEGTFIIKASGASYENGFGFEMNVGPETVAEVQGTSITGSAVTLAANGLEADQDKAVVMVFDNVYHCVSRPEGYYFNTQLEAPYQEPDTLRIKVVFDSPQDPALVGAPPYNPFIFINQNREREVHLAGMSPTSLAAGSEFFDTGDDNSSGSGFYKTANNLPWALDIVETLDYPLEKNTINNAHLFFGSWAVSGGSERADWYKDRSGYRDIEKIYTP